MHARKKFSLSRDFIGTIAHLAEKEVPFPWLYFAEVLPVEDYELPSHPVNFCYRIDNRYSVTLQMRDGTVSPGQLNKWRYHYHYDPISNFHGLISLEQALERIWIHLLQREFIDEVEHLMARPFEEIAKFDLELTLREALETEFSRFFSHIFNRYPIGPYHSCAFYKPFGAEYREPFYFFRVHDSCYEILVGAKSGEIKYRRNEELMSNGTGG